MQPQQDGPVGAFGELSPDRVLNLVEKGLGIRCNNLFRSLNSYINRVFEVETEEGVRLVVKLYRPGRWSGEAIAEEHRFLEDLTEQEIPVIAPLRLQSGTSLGQSEGLFFAVFAKCGGRSVDEFNEEQWLQLGRLLGRVHKVGESRQAGHRITMLPQFSTKDQLDYLQRSAAVPEDLKKPLNAAGRAVVDDIAPLFAGQNIIRIHGDCHFSNLIHRPGESLYLIDFDDMAMGLAVQDMWMLLPGVPEESAYELELLLEGYETFSHFDRRSLRLIEPLRAMRFIHYMAWCAHQVADDGLTRAVDGFGSREYWQGEIEDLLDQRTRIAKGVQTDGNVL